MISKLQNLKSGRTVAAVAVVLFKRLFLAFVVLPATIVGASFVGFYGFNFVRFSSDFAQYVAETGTGDNSTLRMSGCGDSKMSPICELPTTRIVSVDTYAKSMGDSLGMIYGFLALLGAVFYLSDIHQQILRVVRRPVRNPTIEDAPEIRLTAKE